MFCVSNLLLILYFPLCEYIFLYLHMYIFTYVYMYILFVAYSCQTKDERIQNSSKLSSGTFSKLRNAGVHCRELSLDFEGPRAARAAQVIFTGDMTSRWGFLLCSSRILGKAMAFQAGNNLQASCVLNEGRKTNYLTLCDPHHGILSDILPGILSGMLSDIYSDIQFVILSGKHSDSLSGLPSGIQSGVFSDILFEIYSDIPSGILSGTFFDIYSDIQSGILSGTLFDIYYCIIY